MEADPSALDPPASVPPPAAYTSEPPMARHADLERALSELTAGASVLAALPAGDLAALLRATLPLVVAEAERVVFAFCCARGLDPVSPAAAEVWLEGPRALALGARLFADALDSAAGRRDPRLLHSRVGTLLDGRAVVRFDAPSGAGRVLHGGLSAEARLAAGVRANDVARRVGARAGGATEPGITLVLAAGTTCLRASVDALRAVAIERRAVLFSLPPELEALGAALELALAPLVHCGLFRAVVADEALSHAVAHDPLVGAVHVYGSRAAHDELVWGPAGADRAARLAAGAPWLAKPVTSALGNATPILVAPYLYAAGDLAFQAESVATQVAWGGGFDPAAARVLVVARDWAQRGLFVDLVAAALAALPPRAAPHAGDAERFEAALAARGDVVRPGGPTEPSVLGWALVRDLAPAALAEALFSADPLGPVLGVVGLDSEGPADFLRVGAGFCDEQLEGTLCASILAPPHWAEEPALSAALDGVIDGLRYGVVALGAWPGLAFAMGTPPWGAHPSATLAEPGSGLGFTQDADGLGSLGLVDKVVLRSPIRARPRPAWHAAHPHRLELARRLTRLAAFPSRLGALGASLLGARS